MPINRLLERETFNASTANILISVFEDSLRETRMERADPIAKVIAKNIIRFARSGERDPVRLRERATEFLRD